ncbi:MAG: RNA-processing protein [Euryarchaeota archaeon]|nr:RNA-processing protein [Euryarchaeota archaeon]
MTEDVVRIPVRRIGVLIGKNGEVKAELEARAGVVLGIDSESGDVTVEDSKAYDPVVALKVRDIVKAIGRGFSPEHAFRLFQDETYFDVMDVTDYVGKSDKHIKRVRSRLIGTGGKTRHIIEELSGANVSIMGNSVALLGDIMEVRVAREAVEMLMEGAPHSTVYKFLERKRKELRLYDLGIRY